MMILLSLLVAIIGGVMLYSANVKNARFGEILLLAGTLAFLLKADTILTLLGAK